MKFFLDTANIDQITKANAYGILDGITTNPSLIAKEGANHAERILEICEIVDGDVSAEVVETEVEAMLTEGRKLAKIHDNVVVKVPLTRDGIKATKMLSSEGIRVNVTLCFTAIKRCLPPRPAPTTSAHLSAVSTTSVPRVWN